MLTDNRIALPINSAYKDDVAFTEIGTVSPDETLI